MTAPLSFGQSDGWRRINKTVWRQLSNLLRESIAHHARDGRVDHPRVLCVGVPASLTLELKKMSSWTVEVSEHSDGRLNPRRAQICVVMLKADLSDEQRVAILETAFLQVRPGGELILLTNVVGATDEDPLPPATGRLLQEISTATGGAVHLDELRAIRWANEPLHRGVLFEFAVLSRAGSDAP